jgi:uncharacterized protein YaeQ
MAIKSTIYQVELEMVDLDRHHYDPHKLTLACHASETEERLMVRLLAFALNAHERLEFGAGISDSDEPDLWQKDLTGAVELWVELGHPDERLLARACGRAGKVLVYTYSESPERWYEPLRPRLAQLRNLEIWSLAPGPVKELAALAQRRMKLQCTIQEGTVWFRDDQDRAVELAPRRVHF